VSVICGGGSGHEPFATGFTGPGLLSAAVAGATFASPPAAAVAAAIHAVSSPARGCVLLVMNYTGDRLQFGAAAEAARAAGIPVEVVFMADDVALLPPGSGDDPADPAYAKARAGARGIAGNMLVLKAAGAAAAEGRDLAAVAAVARAAASRVSSMGVAVTACTLPGAAHPSDRLAAGTMELGMGLHGEPGAAVVPFPAHDGAAGAVRAVVGALLDRGPVAAAVRRASTAGSRRPGPPVACLVNSLGGLTVLETGCVAGEALAALRDAGLSVRRLYSGVYASSLDMRGFSISLLLLEEDEEEGGGGGDGDGGPPLLPLLDAPVDVAAPWPASPAAVSDAAAPPIPLPAAAAPPATTPRPPPDSPAVRTFCAALRAAAAAVRAVEARLDALDARAGDGDCGATLAGGAAAVEAALDAGKLDLASPRAAAASLAAALTGMGGTSGGLYALFLAGAGGRLPDADAGGWEASGPAEWAAALAAGADAVGVHAGAAPGDRTMLDALLPAARAAADAAGRGGPAAAEAAAAAAAEGAAATASMAGGAGRAAYVPAAALDGSPDPGAEAVAAWLGGVAAALKQA
jgi:triose/dihydroxyacetone kinase / FAD-AMP lyase (cyclizing)